MAESTNIIEMLAPYQEVLLRERGIQSSEQKVAIK
jgi:hypothetical protein